MKSTFKRINKDLGMVKWDIYLEVMNPIFAVCLSTSVILRTLNNWNYSGNQINIRGKVRGYIKLLELYVWTDICIFFFVNTKWHSLSYTHTAYIWTIDIWIERKLFFLIILRSVCENLLLLFLCYRVCNRITCTSVYSGIRITSTRKKNREHRATTTKKKQTR